MTRIALRSSIRIPSHLNMKEGKAVYKMSLNLLQGERVIVQGCANVTNNNGNNVGWGVVIRELTTLEYISPRQTRNVTKDTHHDSNSVMGYFEAPVDGTYTFALILWCGSDAVYGRYLIIDTVNFGQLLIQILGD